MTTTKELLKHLSTIMEQLSKGEIDVEQAKAQANLVKQSNNLLRYELDVEKFKHKMNQEAKAPDHSEP